MARGPNGSGSQLGRRDAFKSNWSRWFVDVLSVRSANMQAAASSFKAAALENRTSTGGGFYWTVDKGGGAHFQRWACARGSN